jgi:hypothetical protein
VNDDAEEVAVMTTCPPIGIAAGAVYKVATPLAVCAGLKLPQAPALPQVAVQSTPVVSPATFATSVADDVSVNVAGGAVDMVTTIGAVFTMVAVADAVIVGLVTEVAVMVTCPFVGIALFGAGPV